MKKAMPSATDILKIVIGSALYAFAFEFFMYGNGLVPGGVTGLAMIINYLLGLPVGVVTIILNIPLFALAWRKLGLGYMIGSLAGMLISSVIVDVFAVFAVTLTEEIFLASIYGGVIKGFGLGLVYSAGANTGGVDIAAKLLRQRYPYINFGTIMLMMDVLVVALFAVLFGAYESAMYSIIAMYILSKVVDLVLYGASASKICYIITDNSKRISDAINESMSRGVTLLHGEGAYSGKDKEIILCVIKRHQIVQLRKIVRELDGDAFMIISDTKEVFGNGFSNIFDPS